MTDKNLKIKIQSEFKNAGIEEMKSALRQVEKEMNNLRKAGQQGSQAWQDLKVKAGVLVPAINELRREFRGLDTDVKKSGSGFTSLSNSMNGISQKMSAMLSGVLALAGGLLSLRSMEQIFDFVKDVTLASARIETLGVVVQQVGKISGYTTNEIDKYVKGVKDMGITTQEAMKTVTKFIQANLDLEQSSKLARIAQDAAVIGGTNSSEALQGLVHGITTQQIEVLRTYGIIISAEKEYAEYAKSQKITVKNLDAHTKQQIILNAVLREGEKIQGTYEASMQTSWKQMTSLARYSEEAANKLGAGFLPVMSKLVGIIKDILTNDKLINFFAELFKVIGDGISKLIDFSKQFIAMVNEVAGGEETFKNIKETIINLIRDGFNWLVDVLTNKVLPAYKELYTTVRKFIDDNPELLKGLRAVAGYFASMAANNFVRIINLMDKIIWFLDKIKYMMPPYWFMKLYGLTQDTTDSNPWKWGVKTDYKTSTDTAPELPPNRKQKIDGVKSNNSGKTSNKEEKEDLDDIEKLKKEINDLDEKRLEYMEKYGEQSGIVLDTINKIIEAQTKLNYLLYGDKKPQPLNINPRLHDVEQGGGGERKGYEKEKITYKQIWESSTEAVNRIGDVFRNIGTTFGVAADTFVGKLITGFDTITNMIQTLVSIMEAADVVKSFLSFIIPGAATGGYISGAGTGTSDSIPAWLSNGEYVINAKSTAMYLPLLEAINKGNSIRNVSKYADGGIVRGFANSTINLAVADVKIKGSDIYLSWRRQDRLENNRKG